MNLNLPSEVERQLTPESAALHLAIGLFVADEVTLGQAAKIAGISQTIFLQELGERKIPIHYGVEELNEDLREIRRLTA